MKMEIILNFVLQALHIFSPSNGPHERIYMDSINYFFKFMAIFLIMNWSNLQNQIPLIQSSWQFFCYLQIPNNYSNFTWFCQTTYECKTSFRMPKNLFYIQSDLNKEKSAILIHNSDFEWQNSLDCYICPKIDMGCKLCGLRNWHGLWTPNKAFFHWNPELLGLNR